MCIASLLPTQVGDGAGRPRVADVDDDHAAVPHADVGTVVVDHRMVDNTLFAGWPVRSLPTLGPHPGEPPPSDLGGLGGVRHVDYEPNAAGIPGRRGRYVGAIPTFVDDSVDPLTSCVEEADALWVGRVVQVVDRHAHRSWALAAEQLVVDHEKTVCDLNLVTVRARDGIPLSHDPRVGEIRDVEDGGGLAGRAEMSHVESVAVWHHLHPVTMPVEIGMADELETLGLRWVHFYPSSIDLQSCLQLYTVTAARHHTARGDDDISSRDFKIHDDRPRPVATSRSPESDGVSEAASASKPNVWALLAVGAVAGLLSGVLGVGGGIIMVPLLTAVLSFDQHRAHAHSLAAIVLIALSAATGFAVAGEIDPVVGLAIGLGGIVGSTAGAHLMHRLSPQALKAVFGILMVATGTRMFWAGAVESGSNLDMFSSLAIGVGIGLVAGVASGVAGIGGGVIMVPAMVFLLGMAQHIAEGTSLMAILFTAVAGTRVNLRNNRVDLRQATIIGVGGVISALIGVQFALGMSSETLTRVFGVFVALVGLRMLVKLLRDRRTAPLAS